MYIYIHVYMYTPAYIYIYIYISRYIPHGDTPWAGGPRQKVASPLSRRSCPWWSFVHAVDWPIPGNRRSGSELEQSLAGHEKAEAIYGGTEVPYFNGLTKKGKILTGNHRFSNGIWDFPVIFPFNQSIEYYQDHTSG